MASQDDFKILGGLLSKYIVQHEFGKELSTQYFDEVFRFVSFNRIGILQDRGKILKDSIWQFVSVF